VEEAMNPLILAALMHAAPAQTYPNVADLEPFTQPANYMSLAGVLVLRYRQAGRWVTRDEARRAAAMQTPNGTLTYSNVTDLTPFTQPCNYMSLYGCLRLRAGLSYYGSRERALATVPSRQEFERRQRLAPPPLPAGH